jgi:hypothetical protein
MSLFSSIVVSMMPLLAGVVFLGILLLLVFYCLALIKKIIFRINAKTILDLHAAGELDSDEYQEMIAKIKLQVLKEVS